MFQVFRRNQKAWLAALTIMAMVAFSFPAFFKGADARRRAKIEVVENIFDHDITNADINHARFERHLANSFVSECMIAVYGVPIVREYFGPTNNDAIRDTFRLAHKADELKITISDDMIRAWIKRLTDEKLSTEQFQQVVNRISKLGKDVNSETLFETLRHQLKLERAYELAFGRLALLGRGTGQAQVTPYEAWQFYRKLNDKVAMKLLPVPVADFVAQIADPGDDELHKLYDRYIDEEPKPSKAEPGFKEPRKVQLQYASATVDAFALALKPDVTDEEIEQYYESHRERYPRLPPAAEPKPSEPPEGNSPESPEKPKTDATKPEDIPKDKSPSGEGDSPAKKEPAAPDEQPSEKKQPEKKPEKQDEADDVHPTSESTASQTESKQEGQQDSKPPRKSAESQSDEKPPAEKAAKPNAKADEHPNANAQEKAPPGDDAGKPASQKTDGTQKPDDGDATDKKKPEPPQYKSLEEVTPEIRDKLARNKAREELLRRLEQAKRPIYDFAGVYTQAKSKYEDAKAKKPDLQFEPPTAPDFSSQIQQLGLQYSQTGLVSVEELSKIPGLGEAVEGAGELSVGRPLIEVVVASATELYEPRDYRNFNEQYFAIWKIADEPARQPAFHEIRPKVLAAYQTMKARELAKQRADELAQALRDSGGDLAKFRETHPSIEPISIAAVSLWQNAPQFSPSAMMPPSEIFGTELTNVRSPGDGLRNAAFSLKENDVGVSPNQPEDTYYVILITKHEPATFEAFARSRSIVERQLQSRRFTEWNDQWVTELRKASSAKAKAPSGN